METLGILGGTGPQGRGLGLRLARAGHQVVIGSRDRERARQAAAKLRAGAPGGEVRGEVNQECARADVVVVAVPYAGQAPLLAELAATLAGKLVVSCVNPLAFDDLGPVPVEVADGSAAEEARRLLPHSRVVSAFTAVSARRLLADGPLADDVPVFGDDDRARAQVGKLAERIPGLRWVDAGPLRLAGCWERLTAVLLSINARYRIHAGVRIDGLEAGRGDA